MNTSLLNGLNRGFGLISQTYIGLPVSRLAMPFIALLLLAVFAPACAPNEPPPERTIPRNLVLLTDTTQWKDGHLKSYKDSLTSTGYRVLVSGYPGENAAELTARLPWLLQPGVDLFLYDKRLAGDAGKDSLVNFLNMHEHPAKVSEIIHDGTTAGGIR
jgi:hypothetical protein